MLSATFPKDVKAFGEKILANPLMFVVGNWNIACGRIHQEILETKETEKAQTLLRVVQERDEPTLVFVEKLDKTEEIYTFLKGHGLSVEFISSNLSQTAREAVLLNLREGRTRILVATNVASRGLRKLHSIIIDIPILCPRLGAE